jgi:hypothetical protein
MQRPLNFISRIAKARDCAVRRAGHRSPPARRRNSGISRFSATGLEGAHGRQSDGTPGALGVAAGDARCSQHVVTHWPSAIL